MDDRHKVYYNIPKVTKTRKCLKCDKSFDSNSPGNRICSKCSVENNQLKLSKHFKVLPGPGKQKEE